MNIVWEISRIVFYCRRYRHSRAYWRLAAYAVVAAVFSLPQLAAATTVPTAVRMDTNLGSIDIVLYDNQTALALGRAPAPITVANFLNYASRGDYNNAVIDRSVHGFILQGGGYKCCTSGSIYPIPTDPPIQNEFDPSRSNVRGTIAMAKVDGDPNSATSEWFFNLADNGGSPFTTPPGLDYQNGGFTVFGRVLDSGMNVVDAIAALQTENFGSPFDHLPVINYDTTVGLQTSNLITVTGISKAAFADTVSGALVIFTADLDMTFSSVGTFISAPSPSTFTPPPNQSVQFNDGIFTFTVTATSVSTRTVTLIDGGSTAPNHYYAYGPTSDNPDPHWYDFSYDGTTGAEFVGNKILLHFVDGQRGDDDLTVDNSITHIGAPALVVPIPSSSSGGCMIAAIPSQTTNNGDWVLISLFLTFVALVRRRTRHDRIQRATNIASP